MQHQDEVEPGTQSARNAAEQRLLTIFRLLSPAEQQKLLHELAAESEDITDDITNK